MMMKIRSPVKVSPRVITITVLAILLLVVLLWGFLDMRKEIPFQEVLSSDGKITLVTGSAYLRDKLFASLYHRGSLVAKGHYDERGVCVFSGLSNNESYEVTLNRTDLKGRILYRPLHLTVTPRNQDAMYVVLVGASITAAWHFDRIPERLNLAPGIALGTRIVYEFDKTRAVRDLASLPVPVSAVILKECAAYFPADLSQSQDLIKRWVEDLRLHQVKPILATVASVTSDHDQKHPGKFQAVLAFNDFIREYASREKIPLLDLEAALRRSPADRHLKEEYAQPDGYHLLPVAYQQALDPLIPALVAAL